MQEQTTTKATALRGTIRRLLPYRRGARESVRTDRVRASAGALAAFVRRPEAIVVPDDLHLRMSAAVAGEADALRQRMALLAVLRTAFADGRAEIRSRFLDDNASGDACVAEQAYLMDCLIGGLARVATDQVFPTPNPTLGERLAIVAVGGYGRGELAPFSDIDLLFLLPYKRNARVEQIVEYMLYLLWDLGLKVGHSVRSIDDCLRLAGGDPKIATTLLETWPIWGDATLYDELRRRWTTEVGNAGGVAFAQAKLAERDARHRRMGDSRYLLEPNIKEGKGALRDLQTLFWIGKYLHQVDDVDGLVAGGMLTAAEAARFRKAQDFLRTVRCHLHYLAGRAEDRLTFDFQPEISRRMGYTDRAGTRGVERLMKHYFLVAKEVGSLTRIFCATLEAEWLRRPRRGLARFGIRVTMVDGFALDGAWLDTARDSQFVDRPVDIVRLFRVAQRTGHDIHPAALKRVVRALRLIDRLRDDRDANRLFLEILTAEEDPEVTLRRMNESGVLPRFIPDFGRVVALMQFDMYHKYTVDEHTLVAIGTLHRILNGKMTEALPLASRIGRQIASRRALFVAILCHDIAKGRGGDHSVLGAEVVRKLGSRFGLSEEETDTAEWLVRWHLLLSDTAQKRDIEDERTIRDFVARVESPERLRLLLVLSCADIFAVGPGRWTAWKAALLSELYYRAEEVLSGEVQIGRGQRIEQAKERLRALAAEWPPGMLDGFLAKGGPGYWVSFDAPTHARHAALIRRAEETGAPLMLETRIDLGRGVTDLTVHAADHPGLFSRLAGAVAVCGGDIVEARVFTLADGSALDVFVIQDAADGGAFAAPERIARLAGTIESSLAGELRTTSELAKRRPHYPSRYDAIGIVPRVLIENEASQTHTVIEVNGRDRPGLLYDVTRALTGLGLQIANAKISTFGARVADVFYVKDVFGLKIRAEAKLARIRRTLLQALGEVEPDTARSGENQPRARLMRRRRKTGNAGF
jgi:[protein-PII] uridylyltransferase